MCIVEFPKHEGRAEPGPSPKAFELGHHMRTQRCPSLSVIRAFEAKTLETQRPWRQTLPPNHSLETNISKASEGRTWFLGAGPEAAASTLVVLYEACCTDFQILRLELPEFL